MVRVLAILCLAFGFLQDGSTIDLAHGTDRERQTKAALERVLASYDLRKYTFTRRVIIEQGAINHAFPVLTLNARFADSPDELLSSYIHEQLHRTSRRSPASYAGTAWK